MRVGSFTSERRQAALWVLLAVFTVLFIFIFGQRTIVTAQQPTPLPATATPVCQGTLPSRMVLHERSRVSYADPSPLNVRSSAGTDGEILGEIPAGGVMYVLDGPICTSRYTWYRVEYRSPNDVLEGWVAEGDAINGYFVEPFPLGR